MQIKEVILKTSMLPELFEFYSKTLRLPVEQMSPGSMAVLVPGTRLVFEKTEEGQPFYHFAFHIPSGKIEEAKAWLHSKTELLWITEHNGPIAEFSSWKARAIYFTDPAGNIVEFIERADLHDKTDEPFGVHQVKRLSEIGLVFPAENYAEQVQQLISMYELIYFNKQPPLDSFCAIGDDEGLFICVTGNRNWYPTQQASGLFPLRVKINNKGKEHTLQY